MDGAYVQGFFFFLLYATEYRINYGERICYSLANMNWKLAIRSR